MVNNGLDMEYKKDICSLHSEINQSFSRAEVAELVDALGSGSSGGFPVRVQVSPSAPFPIKPSEKHPL